MLDAAGFDPDNERDDGKEADAGDKDSVSEVFQRVREVSAEVRHADQGFSRKFQSAEAGRIELHETGFHDDRHILFRIIEFVHEDQNYKHGSWRFSM